MCSWLEERGKFSRGNSAFLSRSNKLSPTALSSFNKCFHPTLSTPQSAAERERIKTWKFRARGKKIFFFFSFSLFCQWKNLKAGRNWKVNWAEKVARKSCVDSLTFPVVNRFSDQRCASSWFCRCFAWCSWRWRLMPTWTTICWVVSGDKWPKCFHELFSGFASAKLNAECRVPTTVCVPYGRKLSWL